MIKDDLKKNKKKYTIKKDLFSARIELGTFTTLAWRYNRLTTERFMFFHEIFLILEGECFFLENIGPDMVFLKKDAEAD